MAPASVRMRPLLVVWTATRVIAVVLLALNLTNTIGDASYFARQLHGLGPLDLSDALREYPTPAALMLWVVDLLARSLGVPLLWALMATTIACDAAVLAVLARRRDPFALWAWVLGVAALGPVAFSRFDLIPGSLIGLAVLAALTRPRLAGALAAVATGLKIWPIVTLLPLMARTALRTRLLVAFTATGVAVLAISWAAGGFDRLTSPLLYQSDRGLQVESVVATPVMLAHAVRPEHWHVALSPVYHAVQIRGTGAGVMLVVSTLITVLYAVVMLLSWVNLRLWVEPRRVLADHRSLWALLAAVSGFMVTSKVLSPQYFLWLLPIAVAAATVTRDRMLRRWVIALCVACALTTVIYPWLYEGVDTEHANAALWPATVALVGRNFILVGLCVTAFAHALRGVSDLPRSLRGREPVERHDSVSSRTTSEPTA